jgi:hypothetical protein
VSGYFNHGKTRDALEQKNPVANPKPTFLTMSTADIASCTYTPPIGPPAGSDYLLNVNGVPARLFKSLKEKTFYPDAGVWKDIEFRFIAPDRSPWEMIWTILELRDEMASEAKRDLRNLTIMTLAGANHFVSHLRSPILPYSILICFRLIGMNLTVL